ncbi:p-aminobenzoyl-glutamate hydrolase subunit AbgB, partial [Escherichia coli]|nr:p-aminobenzoyl-glutamate hydrolase subunit AbgB [Escherichia coli]EJZ1701522.1 p-aminobenzoyl-glutamate hydrolase subunit AbgB [Escherichia coli]
MQEIYRFIDDAIEADRQRYTDIADQIWDHPETRFEEFWSAEHLASALESAGFTVTRNVGNIPNAFIASFGQGKPVIALLGEYDALAGLSQQAGCAQPTSVTPGENGHGCGHNLLGTAAFAAAIAVKKWLEQYGQGGTVRFYGCPGEEGGSGKTFMVREGVFDDVDAALTWHPEAFAGMFNTRTLANIQASWRFKGIAAHAANSPHLGRSALDAVTLMTTGTNFLNEHIIEKARVHYAITNSGGISPNVVQAQAEVL